jgi:hypothetical protein
MRRTSLAGLVAAPLLLMFAVPTQANPPSQCFGPFGGGGFCMGLFSKMHQHGPLFNYGPYYGYPPFEPYGPWNAYLQYNPWYYGYGNGGGGHGFGHGHGGGLLHGRLGGHGCGHCGHFHAGWRDGGWFRGHGCVGCGKAKHFGSGCDGCRADAGSTTDVGTRFAGAGSPQEYASFYAGLPTLAVTPAGGVR